MQRIFREFEELVLVALLITDSRFRFAYSGFQILHLDRFRCPKSGFRVNLWLPRNFLCLVQL